MDEVSSCGLFDCKQCKFRRGSVCLGCGQGNAFLEQWGREPCRVYTCVRSKGLTTCRECTEAVCALRGATDTVCPLRAGIENKRHWAWKLAQHLEGKGTPCHAGPSVPLKTLMRLRWYLSALEYFKQQGVDVVSSRELADRGG